MTWPVMYDDSSMHRNTVALAISAGSPARRTGVMLAKCSMVSVNRPSATARSVIGVTTMPGGMVLTVMPRGPSSNAMLLVKPIRPALELT